MMFSTLLLLAPAWYGPVTVGQAFPTTGNPFSPTENDVRVVFTRPGKRLERLAYFAKGQWHATLAADTGGEYQAQFIRNGKNVGTPAKVTLKKAKDGDFVLRDGRRFKLTSGKSFIPFGHNFGWQGGRDASYEKQLRDMAQAGLNWTRVWANSWDTKNPFVPPDEKTKIPLGTMYEPALDRWDMVVENCERNDVKFQFVLFHHGLFSTTTDANWNTHPWNKANGGFLERANDFFTDSQAKTLSKAWLRYAVARWGHSTSVMAWELFNEVQWVDKTKETNGWDTVASWHGEMAQYLRSIDPYRHLVTSSSEVPASVYEAMDFEQPHTYPPSVYGALLGAKTPDDKPLFFGEFGGDGGRDMGAAEKQAVRDGFWGGLLAGHAGPGAYWFWDRIYKNNLYAEFGRLAKILKRSGFAENPQAKPAPITVTGAPQGDLTFRPGRGWAPTEKFVYDLPTDAATGALPQLSGYLQGAKGGNRTLMQEPIRLRFTAPTAGVAKVRLAQVAKKGGALQIRVNGGEPVIDRTWPTSEQDTPVTEAFDVPFTAGKNEIVIDNPGEDWVILNSVTLPGVGSGVAAVSLRSDRYSLMRLQWQKEFGPAVKTLSLPGLSDGNYEMRQFDAETGAEKVSRVKVVRSRIEGYVPFALDEGVALFRR
jgi:hypothetical protein